MNDACQIFSAASVEKTSMNIAWPNAQCHTYMNKVGQMLCKT